jgi:hypothetical protein
MTFSSSLYATIVNRQRVLEVNTQKSFTDYLRKFTSQSLSLEAVRIFVNF